MFTSSQAVNASREEQLEFAKIYGIKVVDKQGSLVQLWLCLDRIQATT